MSKSDRKHRLEHRVGVNNSHQRWQIGGIREREGEERPMHLPRKSRRNSTLKKWRRILSGSAKYWFRSSSTTTFFINITVEDREGERRGRNPTEVSTGDRDYLHSPFMAFRLSQLTLKTFRQNTEIFERQSLAENIRKQFTKPLYQKCVILKLQANKVYWSLVISVFFDLSVSHYECVK